MVDACNVCVVCVVHVNECVVVGVVTLDSTLVFTPEPQQPDVKPGRQAHHTPEPTETRTFQLCNRNMAFITVLISPFCSLNRHHQGNITPTSSLVLLLADFFSLTAAISNADIVFQPTLTFGVFDVTEFVFFHQCNLLALPLTTCVLHILPLHGIMCYWNLICGSFALPPTETQSVWTKICLQ